MASKKSIKTELETTIIERQELPSFSFCHLPIGAKAPVVKRQKDRPESVRTVFSIERWDGSSLFSVTNRK